MFNVVGNLQKSVHQIFTSGNGIEDTLLVAATKLPYILRYVQFRVEERSKLEVAVCVERGAIGVMKQGFVYAGYFPCKNLSKICVFFFYHWGHIRQHYSYNNKSNNNTTKLLLLLLYVQYTNAHSWITIAKEGILFTGVMGDVYVFACYAKCFGVWMGVG